MGGRKGSNKIPGERGIRRNWRQIWTNCPRSPWAKRHKLFKAKWVLIRTVRLATGAGSQRDPYCWIDVIVNGLHRTVAKHDVDTLRVLTIGIFNMVERIVRHAAIGEGAGVG